MSKDAVAAFVVEEEEGAEPGAAEAEPKAVAAAAVVVPPPPAPAVPTWVMPGLPHVSGPYVVGTTDIEWAEPQFAELVVDGAVRQRGRPQ